MLDTNSTRLPLHIPHIEAFDSFDPETIISTLQDKGVTGSIEHANWSEYQYKPLAVFNAAHDGKYIYIDFFVRCNYLRAVNSEDNSPVSQDSCVEFFVSPTCDNHYWNFEFNCIGTINASHRSVRNNPTRLTHGELAQVLRYCSCGTRPFNEVEGLFAWNVLIAVPLSLIGATYTGSPIEMTANFNKCASGTSQPHFLSWNPIISEKPDFHRPECFAKIVLE